MRGVRAAVKFYMKDILIFKDREQFRKWLLENCRSGAGVWLLFGKSGGPETLKAHEALEEALCFGWIDGQMQSIDGNTYKKYFAERRPDGKWSDKNKALVNSLEERGLMTDYGREKIDEAKKNGKWDEVDLMSLGDEAIAVLSGLIEGYEPAYANFKAMPQSVKKTYARAYFDAKTEKGKSKRLAWIVDRLNKNLRPV